MNGFLEWLRLPNSDSGMVWYSLICASCKKQESNNPDILDKEGLTWIIVIYQTLNYKKIHFQ
jgi:hypothetical protein